MKLKALVIDDEPLAHEIIRQYVDDVDFIELVGHCHLATEALAFLQQHAVDLIFLDVQMPKLKGNEFLKTLNHKPWIIITSAHEQYALESFELDVSDYLLKPFRFERFLKAANKVYTQQAAKLSMQQTKKLDIPANKPSASTPEEVSKTIGIKVDKKYLQVRLEDIYYLESYGNYVKVWLDNAYHLTPATLISFENKLRASDYVRTHKSFIVNKLYIDYLEGNRMYLKNKSEIPIGKSYKQIIMELLT